MKQRYWALWSLAVVVSGGALGGTWLHRRDNPEVFVPPGSAVEMRLRQWLGRLWSASREGKLQPGDPAPDFDLPSLGSEARVRPPGKERSR